MTTSVSSKSLAFRAAHWVHMTHKGLFSAYRLKRSGISLREPLDPVEREFVLQFASAFRQPDLVVFDIGAAVGVVSRTLAKLTNVKEVHAFEPIPDSFQLLRKQVAGYPCVKCHNVALGSHNQREKLHLSSLPDSSSLLPMAESHKTEFPDSANCREIEVEVARLDDFVAAHQLPLPDVIKIDVQGYELEALKGGLQALRHARYCVIEMSFFALYEGSPIFEDVYQFMVAQGFILRGTGGVAVNSSCTPLQIDGIFERVR